MAAHPFNILACARPNILALKPYHCARDDYKDDATKLLLDANENAWGPCVPLTDVGVASGAIVLGLDVSRLHRYPDPHQHTLKQLLCNMRNVDNDSPRPLCPENVFVGVSSDESIDAIMRCFCVPGRDAVIICPPTYGMYGVSAQINDVAAIKIPLRMAPEFQLDLPAIFDALDSNPYIKLIYLASPGNPTGSLLAGADIKKLLAHPTWNGVVVLDEAYIDYSPKTTSFARSVTDYPNLAVIHTFSKAFGMAGIRLGVIFTSAPIAKLLNSLKSPYNVSSTSSALASYCVKDKGLSVMLHNRERMVAQRNYLLHELPKITGVGRLRSGLDGNFLMYEILNAKGLPDSEVALQVYQRLAGTRGVVVRFRGYEHGCVGCLRFTVGREEDVTRLLDSLRRTLAEVRGTE